MGASVVEEDRRLEGGEWVADVVVRAGALRATERHGRAGPGDGRRDSNARLPGDARRGRDGDHRRGRASREGERSDRRGRGQPPRDRRRRRGAARRHAHSRIGRAAVGARRHPWRSSARDGVRHPGRGTRAIRSRSTIGVASPCRTRNSGPTWPTLIRHDRALRDRHRRTGGVGQVVDGAVGCAPTRLLPRRFRLALPGGDGGASDGWRHRRRAGPKREVLEAARAHHAVAIGRHVRSADRRRERRRHAARPRGDAAASRPWRGWPAFACG